MTCTFLLQQQFSFHTATSNLMRYKLYKFHQLLGISSYFVNASSSFKFIHISIFFHLKFNAQNITNEFQLLYSFAFYRFQLNLYSINTSMFQHIPTTYLISIGFRLIYPINTSIFQIFNYLYPISIGCRQFYPINTSKFQHISSFLSFFFQCILQHQIDFRSIPI